MVLSTFSCACWPFVYLLWKDTCSGPLPVFVCPSLHICCSLLCVLFCPCFWFCLCIFPVTLSLSISVYLCRWWSVLLYLCLSMPPCLFPSQPLCPLYRPHNQTGTKDWAGEERPWPGIQIKIKDHQPSLAFQWLRLDLPMQRVWVQCLVGELGSHMPQGQKNKT